MEKCESDVFLLTLLNLKDMLHSSQDINSRSQTREGFDSESCENERGRTDVRGRGAD